MMGENANSACTFPDPMWDKDDPKTKWFHFALKLLTALVIFKLGVLVGEFKMVKAMVVGGGAHQKMLFRADDEKAMGTPFFHKRVMPMGGEGDVMMWRGDEVRPEGNPAPIPPAPLAPQAVPQN